MGLQGHIRGCHGVCADRREGPCACLHPLVLILPVAPFPRLTAGSTNTGTAQADTRARTSAGIARSSQHTRNYSMTMRMLTFTHKSTCTPTHLPTRLRTTSAWLRRHPS